MQNWNEEHIPASQLDHSKARMGFLVNLVTLGVCESNLQKNNVHMGVHAYVLWQRVDWGQNVGG